MTDKPPDAAPVSRAAVAELLAWMRQRCKDVPRYDGMDEHWFTALQTLTMGDIRRGAKYLQGLSRPTYIAPHLFWLVCKGQQLDDIKAHLAKLRKAARKSTE